MSLMISHCGCKNKSAEKDVTTPISQIIEVDSTTLDIYDQDIAYLREKFPREKEAIKALENIKQLFVQNNYAITKPEDLEEYYRNLEIFSEFVDKQSFIVKDRLSSMH